MELQFPKPWEFFKGFLSDIQQQKKQKHFLRNKTEIKQKKTSNRQKKNPYTINKPQTTQTSPSTKNPPKTPPPKKKNYFRSLLLRILNLTRPNQLSSNLFNTCKGSRSFQWKLFKKAMRHFNYEQTRKIKSLCMVVKLCKIN